MVDEDRGVAVGREPSCEFVVRSKEVSRRHARFFVRDGALQVEDLGSHNGVYVEGRRIPGPTPVAAGSLVELGDVRCAISGSPGTKAARAEPRPNAPAEAPAPGSARAGAAAARARAAAQGQGRAQQGARTRELPKLERPQPKPRPAPAPQPSVQGVGAGAALRSLGKAGTQIVLPARAVVGRGADCDVVLDDGSVSRRHAELFRDGRGLYRVKDLDSANGTFVDDERVEGEVLLADGAKLRFGDVELLLWKPPTERARPRSRLGLQIGALVALVAAFAGLSVWRGRVRAEREAEEHPAAASAEEEARTLGDQARAALQSDHFDEAIRLAQAAVDRDPLAQAPRRLLAQARREQVASKSFAEAESKASLGVEDEAIQLLAQVDPQSRFFARARIKAKDLAPGLVRKQGKSCQAQAAREAWDAAARACSLALDLKCQQQAVEDDPLLKTLRRAERSLSRRVAWSCPTQLAPLFRDTQGPVAGEADPQQALQLLYPNDKVRAAMTRYARGEVAAALKSLADPAVSRGPGGTLARELAEKIRLVDGRFREGQTAMLRADLVRADDAWSFALRTDGALLPAGLQSALASQMRQSLAQAHAKLGDERFQRGQYQSAFDEWTRGLSASPRDPHLLDQIARLEKVAEGILSAESACDQLQTAARITRADPPSPAHKAALEALERCK